MSEITNNKIIEVETICRVVFENSMDAILLASQDGRLFAANPAACDMFGMSETELISSGRKGLMDSTDENLSVFLAEEESKGKALGELGLRRKDGSIFPAEVSSGIFKSRDGVDFTILIIRDITKIRQSILGLHKAEFLLNKILFSAPITIFATDKEGRFIHPDGKSLKNVGVKSEENVGVSAYDLYGLLPFTDFSGNVLTGKEIFDRAIKGEIVTAINQIKEMYFENHIGPLIDKDGEITGAVGVAIDITERKRIEDSLSLSQENLDLALKSAEMGVWQYDISQNARIYNGLSCRLLDIGATTFSGTEKEFFCVVHSNDRLKIRKALKKSISTNTPYSVEYRVKIKDGTVRYISERGKLISGSDGNAKKIVGMLWDSTDKNMFEEKLKKSRADIRQYAEELRALFLHIDTVIEKERNQIARDLHDELGQKLTALNLNISWIKSRMGVQSPCVSNKLVEMENLLSVAVDSINKISFRLRPPILDDLGIKEVIESQLSNFSKATGIRYSVSFVPENISIDPDLSLIIFRIVQESLTNVARHSKATNLSVYISSGKDDLRLLIRDNGIGIAQDKVTNSKSFGLIGMRERVCGYGGEFVIKGRPDNGTVIRIKLPRTFKQ